MWLKFFFANHLIIESVRSNLRCQMLKICIHFYIFDNNKPDNEYRSCSRLLMDCFQSSSESSIKLKRNSTSWSIGVSISAPVSSIRSHRMPRYRSGSDAYKINYVWSVKVRTNLKLHIYTLSSYNFQEKNCIKVEQCLSFRLPIINWFFF